MQKPPAWQCVRDPPKPKGYLHYQLIEYLSVCMKMGPRGIATNTSQHETPINCILKGSRRGLCLETETLTSHHCKPSQITSAWNAIWNHIEESSVLYWDWRRWLTGVSLFGLFPLSQPVFYNGRNHLEQRTHTVCMNCTFHSWACAKAQWSCRVNVMCISSKGAQRLRTVNILVTIQTCPNLSELLQQKFSRQIKRLSSHHAKAPFSCFRWRRTGPYLN